VTITAGGLGGAACAAAAGFGAVGLAAGAAGFSAGVAVSPPPVGGAAEPSGFCSSAINYPCEDHYTYHLPGGGVNDGGIGGCLTVLGRRTACSRTRLGICLESARRFRTATVRERSWAFEVAELPPGGTKKCQEQEDGQASAPLIIAVIVPGMRFLAVCLLLGVQAQLLRVCHVIGVHRRPIFFELRLKTGARKRNRRHAAFARVGSNPENDARRARSARVRGARNRLF
jgi:hypothetical protein